MRFPLLKNFVYITFLYRLLVTHFVSLQSESKKIPPPLRGPGIFHFFHKQLRIFNRFFTHLLYVPTYARLQIFIQLSPILTKLCHIKRNHPVHIICSKCPQSAKTHALTRLRKSLIVVCGNNCKINTIVMSTNMLDMTRRQQ